MADGGQCALARRKKKIVNVAAGMAETAAGLRPASVRNSQQQRPDIVADKAKDMVDGAAGVGAAVPQQR